MATWRHAAVVHRPVARRAARCIAWIAAIAALAAVFASYLRSDVIVDLANRVWSCF